MKKILYTLLMVSLFSVSCTEMIPVSRDHDLDAEVKDIEITMEKTALYCNLNKATEVDFEKLGAYLSAEERNVVTFVAPATVGTTSFVEWLTAYAGDEWQVLSETNTDGRLVMAALVNKETSIEVEKHTVEQLLALKNAVLHFSVDNIHYVVTEFEEARNAIPADWEEQIQNMLSTKKTVPFVYTPDVIAERILEVEYFVEKTLENDEFIDDEYWMLCVNMNAHSSVDLKYGKEFPLEKYYDNVDVEALVKRHHKYCTIEPNLAATDIYFDSNDLLVRCGMTDCVAVKHSIYTPSCTDGSRTNFLYSSMKLWNMLSVEVDKSSEWGAAYYPIKVSLKKEE